MVIIMIKYSLIIPVYNAEAYLEQCLNSLLMQSFIDFEIILINDCSSDNSLDICMKYKNIDSRVQVLNQLKNKGVSAARNKGIEYARGKYILFIDSDDFVSKTYFDILEELTKDEIYDLFSFGNYECLMFDDNKHVIKQGEMNININFESINSWSEFILNSFFLSPWNKIYKRDIILKHSIFFDEACVCYEDYLFNIEYCRFVKNFICIDEPIYYYRIFKNVNHVLKRKWGKRFFISEKVAIATNRFIAENSRNKSLNNLRRLTYKAFLVELEASKLSDNNFKEDLNTAINNSYFLESINSIVPKGIKLTIFIFAKKCKLDFICRFIIKKLM